MPMNCVLKKLQVEVFANLVFVNINANAAPLKNQLGDLETELRSFAPELDFLTLTDSREYKIKANWKNIMENYCECYHCPNAHPDFASGIVDINSYRIKTYDIHHAHTSRSRPPEEGSYKIDADASERGAEVWFVVYLAQFGDRSLSRR